MTCVCMICGSFIHSDTDYEMFDTTRMRIYGVCKECYVKSYHITNDKRIKKKDVGGLIEYG